MGKTLLLRAAGSCSTHFGADQKGGPSPYSKPRYAKCEGRENGVAQLKPGASAKPSPLIATTTTAVAAHAQIHRRERLIVSVSPLAYGSAS